MTTNHQETAKIPRSRPSVARRPPTWIFAAIGFLLFAQAVSAASLSINGAERYQTIDGFGTNINSLSWNNDNSKAAIDLLADQMGQTLWRVVFDMEDWEATNDNADPNTPDWAYYNTLYSSAKFQNLWGTLRYLNQKGFNTGIALSFMGRVPTWMGGATINTTQEDEAVEMIATLIYYARNTAQVQFGMLDPFNEWDWDGIEGPQLETQQYVRLLRKISAKLDAMGLADVRLLGPNAMSVNDSVSTFMPAMMADSVVMSKVDHFAFHSYSNGTGGADSAIKNSPYSGKNFWMTEYANPVEAFTLLGQNASALLVWEGFDSVYNHAILAGRGSQPGNDDVGYVPLAYDTSTRSYTPRKEFYQSAQLFKFILPGSVRIAATGAAGGLTTLAFYHQGSGQITIVARNTGSTATVSATLTNLPAVSSFAYYKTDSTSNLVRAADVPVNSRVLSFSVPSGGIVTLTTVSPQTAPTLSSVTVTPPNPTVQAGTAQQFAALGTYSNGSTQYLTSQVSWFSSDTTTATITTTGLATGTNVGTTTISATQGSITGSTVLTVQSTSSGGTGGGGTSCTSNCTIWPSTAVPETASGSDTSAVEVGLKFTSDVPGQITGIRFYKGSTNTGTHIGNLWTANGTKLASAAFANETSSGWQQVNFATPVTIAANTTYIASYFAPAGGYSLNQSGLSTSVDNAPLHALSAGASGGNGVYAYGTGRSFPAQTWNASNYWVDVVFSAASAADTTAPSTPANVSGTAGSSVQINLSWSASTDNVGVTAYLIESCQGSSCTNFAQIGTASGTTYAHVGLTASTAYRYRVRARDAAGNLSAYSAPASAMTAATSSSTGPVFGIDSSTPATVKGSSAILTTATFTPPAGAVLYVMFMSQQAVTNMTDSLGTHLTYTQHAIYGNPGGGDAMVALYTAPVTTSQAMTLSVTQAAGNQQAMLKVLVATGADMASPVGANGGGRGFPGVVSDTYTSTRDGSLGWLLHADWMQAAVPTPGTGQALYDSYTVSGQDTYAIIQRSAVTPSAGTSVTMNTTAPTSGGQISHLYFEMKPAAAVSDTTAPSTPPELSAAAVSTTQINLSWTASADDVGVMGYKVYRGGTLVATIAATSYIDAGLSASTTYTYNVAAYDAAGNMSALSSSASATTMAPATTPPDPNPFTCTSNCTIWPSTAVPETASGSDTSAVEVGLKFTSDVPGQITGIRFYKGSTNTGTQIANLWTANGTNLASATFTNETSSGWQQVNFATPVTIAANTVYVASYFAPAGGYSLNQSGLSTSVDNAPLHALSAGASGGNGVYAYGTGSSFPAQTWNGSNYWVDVVFTPMSITGCTPPPAANGLVAAYGFEEASGATVLDQSGNCNTGTRLGTTRVIGGKFGKALSFNGSSDWITVPDSASLDVTMGLTIEAWVNPATTPSGWSGILYKEAPSGAVYDLMANSGTSSTTGPLAQVSTTGNTWLETSSAPRLTAGTWTHVAASYDGSKGILRLYVDGTLVTSWQSSGTIITSDGVLRIGGHGLWGQYFNGLIDEVRIYNRRLFRSEIQTDMNTAVGP